MTAQMATLEQRSDNWAKEMEALHRRDEELSLFEYWSTETVAHDATNKLQRYVRAVPHCWHWRDLLPCIEKSGELVSMNDSERRTLILMNPALAPTIATVTTMYAGYRINLPGEIGPCHRHSPNAVRLGLTGDTNFTVVEGEQIRFGYGDLVLTPHDCWHSHAVEEGKPAINISYLDHPLCNTLNATYFDSDLYVEENGVKVRRDLQPVTFARDYSVNTYKRGGLRSRTVNHLRGTGGASPMYVYRWDQTREFLYEMRDHDASPYDGVMVEYTDPLTGGPVYRTMNFIVRLLRPGERTLPVRQNASLMCTILQGSGRSTVGDKTFEWDQFDTFCVPGQQWCEHWNPSETEDAIMMVVTDEPALQALGLQVKHGKTPSGEVVLLDQ